MGLGQYDSLGEYYGPHTASSVFRILKEEAVRPCKKISNVFEHGKEVCGGGGRGVRGYRG